MPTVVGWMITDPHQADDMLKGQHADLVLLCREMLCDPYWPYHAAAKLGVDSAAKLRPVQHARAVKRCGHPAFG